MQQMPYICHQHLDSSGQEILYLAYLPVLCENNLCSAQSASTRFAAGAFVSDV